jgi:hypothetical protein
MKLQLLAMERGNQTRSLERTRGIILRLQNKTLFKYFNTWKDIVVLEENFSSRFGRLHEILDKLRYSLFYNTGSGLKALTHYMLCKSILSSVFSSYKIWSQAYQEVKKKERRVWDLLVHMFNAKVKSAFETW